MKVSLVLERLSLMVMFYLSLKKSLKEEKPFLQKILLRIYSNICFVLFYFKTCHFSEEQLLLFENEFKVFGLRNHSLIKMDMEPDLERNNDRIYSYLIFLTEGLSDRIIKNIQKLREFIDDLTVAESLKFIIHIFNNLYQEHGVVHQH